MKDGGPAFPGFGQVFTTDAQGSTMPQGAWGIQGAEGMSLRDWFAGQALAGMLAYPESSGGCVTIATAAYDFADAMLAEREKGR